VKINLSNTSPTAEQLSSPPWVLVARSLRLLSHRHVAADVVDFCQTLSSQRTP
jgi:hypothetical protein